MMVVFVVRTTKRANSDSSVEFVCSGVGWEKTMQQFDQVSVRYCSLTNCPGVGLPVDGMKGESRPLVLVPDIFEKWFVSRFVL